MAAFSYNFMIFLAALSLPDADCLEDPNSPACDPEQGDPECTLSDPVRCGAQRAAISVTGVQRPEVRAGGNGRFGRRDWVWSGGGEAVLRYARRPRVRVLAGQTTTQWDAQRGDLRLNYRHEGLVELLVEDGGRAPLRLLVADEVEQHERRAVVVAERVRDLGVDEALLAGGTGQLPGSGEIRREARRLVLVRRELPG